MNNPFEVGGAIDKMFEAGTPQLYYIQDSRTFCGNSVMWWRPNGDGYTSNLDKAWKVPSTWKGRDTDRLWPCDAIDALAARQFDMQLFRAIPVAVDDTSRCPEESACFACKPPSKPASEAS